MEIILEKKTIFRILKNKRKLKEKLEIKINPGRNGIEIFGEADKEFIAERVFFAIQAGFPINAALLLTDEDYLIERVGIKDITKRKSLEQVRARIIGRKGKTLELLCHLSDCFIQLRDNEVYIIGGSEDIKAGIQALKNLISGSKQGNVYKYLEKTRARKKKESLGIKNS